ncbi:hypothetical protein Cgig2_033674 [Carnegiea gigantea]|uniref:Phytocyanin domain-containing protein n=1 Tax=Carnegiea gigantea TaxID=171969 RepID=A0A9Q1GIX9_9CARY|nr:hypothetical protein Cgig2_033674 [Carnegiea gigantea]
MGFSNLPIIWVLVIVMVGIQLQAVEVLGFKQVLVGGHSGWHIPDSNQTDFYNQWAQSKRFHVGDSLRKLSFSLFHSHAFIFMEELLNHGFQYQNDSLLVVDKYGYYHCDPSRATSTYNDGNTVIKLENPGLIYFISGSPDHCREGQRMVVDVMSHHSSPGPESKGEAESPASARKSGSQMVKVSELLGLVVAGSLFLF